MTLFNRRSSITSAPFFMPSAMLVPHLYSKGTDRLQCLLPALLCLLKRKEPTQDVCGLISNISFSFFYSFLFPFNSSFSTCYMVCGLMSTRMQQSANMVSMYLCCLLNRNLFWHHISFTLFTIFPSSYWHHSLKNQWHNGGLYFP